MAATYHRAVSENGDRIDDPSEDAIYVLVVDLQESDDTFVVVLPARLSGRPRPGEG